MRRLVLCSGGMKSFFLLALAQKEGDVVPLFLDYARPNVLAEWEAMEACCQHLTLQPQVCKISGCPNVKETLLRFLFFVLYSLPVARQHQCRMIYHGLSKSGGPTKMPVEPFIKGLQAMIEMAQPLYDGKGGWLGSIEVETPLRRLVAGQALRLGNEYRLPWHLTWSCEASHHLHCGNCRGCLRRKESFKQEGKTKDPTIYAK